MKPKPMPSVMEYANGIMAIVKKLGIATSKSLQSMRVVARSIKIPTMTSAGAVAAAGTMPATGAMTMEAKKHSDTTMLERPVRAPSLMPVEDSTKVVTVEVPKQAPTQVAIASASSARSPRGSSPFSFSMPALPAVPISVPTVSNISQMENVMMAVTSGRMPSESRLKSICIKVGASEKLFSNRLAGITVMPMGMPISVVMPMPIRMAALTFHAISTPVIKRPMSASSAGPEIMLPISGTAPPTLTTPTFSKPMRAINRPIPALIALFSGAGIASMTILRSGEMVTSRNKRPDTNTIARPCCQV
ncbi:hypothetical protein SDC9_153894 [bioreactor metagenome]|uniref:Uncharacterized protein n=1 Tax=bioreactor metagenome TaxID=1076179 RepID=A0A645EX73_9ZZZZ